MADWTSGFDALRTALQFRAQQDAQKKQDQDLADYRNQTLELERSRQEQLRKSNEAAEAYRQSMLDAQKEQIAQQRDRFDLDVDAQLFDQSLKAPSVRPGFPAPMSGFPSMMPQMPGAPQPPGPPMGGNMNPFSGLRLKSVSVNKDGFPSYNYAPEAPSPETTFVTKILPGGSKAIYERQKTADGYTEDRIPKSELKDGVVTLANVQTALKSLNELERAVSQYGNYESPNMFTTMMTFKNPSDQDLQEYERRKRSGTLTEEEKRLGAPMANTEAASILGADPYRLAMSVNKVMDPNSAVLGQEVEAAKKYLIPMGAFTNNDVTLHSIKSTRQQVIDRANELGFADQIKDFDVQRAPTVELPLQNFDTMDDFIRSGFPAGRVFNVVSGVYEKVERGAN